jgi:hypothetical protein
MAAQLLNKRAALRLPEITSPSILTPVARALIFGLFARPWRTILTFVLPKSG